jgi:hypothetical protein
MKTYTQKDKYEKSGMCQIKCLDCPLKYIGKMGRIFHTRYGEIFQRSGIVMATEDIQI